MKKRFVLLGTMAYAGLLLVPAGAGPAALSASVVNAVTTNVTRSFNVYNPAGTVIRTQSYRLTNAGGNCCEVQLGVTPAGRILEFGGDYPFYSDDRGVSWKRVVPLAPITGAEGSISAAPGGDVVGMTWSPYVADEVVSYKYTASTGQWQTEVVPLHTPFFDRPWLTVVKGPITWAGGTAPYVAIIHGGWPAKEVEYVSYDGLSYVGVDSRAVDSLTSGPRPAVVASADLDAIQGPAPAEIAAVGAGRALRRDTGTAINGLCASRTFGMNPNGSWYCVTNMGGTALGGVYRADSGGWLHEVVASGNTVRVRTSTTGGAFWSVATATLPAGASITDTMPDVKADGVRKRLYVGLRVLGTGSPGDQDMVLRFDYTGGIPAYAERWHVGFGDLIVGSSLGAGQRMDFTSLVVLPDGRVVTTFTDSTTGGSPSMAIQL